MTTITRTWPDPAWVVQGDDPILEPLRQALAAGGDIRFEIQQDTSFHRRITQLRALAVTDIAYDTDKYPGTNANTRRVIGLRTLSDIRASGYDHEGRVSVDGKKYRAFTSDMLVTDDDGKRLIKVAVLYVCMTKAE